VSKRFSLFKSIPLQTRQLLVLGFTLSLALTLPLFLWGLMTQNLDIRERAATGETTPTPTPTATPKPTLTTACWNKVFTNNNQLVWPNGCAGRPDLPTGRGNVVCTQVITPLTQEQITQYYQWIAAGKPYVSYCGMATPTPTPYPSTIIKCTGQCLGDPLGSQYPLGHTCVGMDYLCYVCGTNGSFFVSSGACGGPAPTSPTPTATPTPTPTPVTNRPWPYRLICTVFPRFCRPAPSPIIKVTPTPSPTVSPTPTATPIPLPQTMRFQFKFMGVSGDQADGAKLTIRFRTNDGSVDRVTPALTASHVGNGIYETIVQITDNFLPANRYDYAIYLKGEKHLARKFCQQGGQTTRCTGNGNLAVSDTISGYTNFYDFTGLPLEPGDLPMPEQDGAANLADFTKIKSLLSKASSELTAADKLTADLDYNGSVNVRDAFLMRQTLETRYDED